MGGFKIPEHKTARTLDYHELALNFFRSYLLQMGERKKSDEEIKAFTRNPSPETFGLQADPNRDKFFEIIKHHSTFDERKAVVLELANAGKL